MNERKRMEFDDDFDICDGDVDDMDSGDWEAFWAGSQRSSGERHFNDGFELVFEEEDRFNYLA